MFFHNCRSHFSRPCLLYKVPILNVTATSGPVSTLDIFNLGMNAQGSGTTQIKMAAFEGNSNVERQGKNRYLYGEASFQNNSILNC